MAVGPAAAGNLQRDSASLGADYSTTSGTPVYTGLSLTVTARGSEIDLGGSLSVANGTAGAGVTAFLYRSTTVVPAAQGDAPGGSDILICSRTLTSSTASAQGQIPLTGQDAGLTTGNTYYYYVCVAASGGGTATAYGGTGNPSVLTSVTGTAPPQTGGAVVLPQIPTATLVSQLDLAIDVKRDYGASGSDQSTTGSISAGSAVLTLVSAIDFKVGQGISIANAGAAPTITAPTAATATAEGTTGSTTIAYAVAALDGKGGVTASFAFSVTDVNATLSATDYVALSVTAVSGAAGYAWWRTRTNGTSPTTTGYIGWTSGTTLDDTGLAVLIPPTGVPEAAPATALGDFLVSQVTAVNGTNFTLADAAGSTVSGATVNHDDTSAINESLSKIDGLVIIPEGTYVISSAISPISNSSVIIIGTIQPVSAAQDFKSTSGNTDGLISLEDLSNVSLFGRGQGTVLGQISATSVMGIDLYDCTQCLIDGITVKTAGAHGIHMNHSSPTNSFNKISGCVIDDCGNNGIMSEGGGALDLVVDNTFSSNFGPSIGLYDATYCLVSGNVINNQGGAYPAINAYFGAALVISDNLTNDGTAQSIQVTSSTGTRVVNNICRDCAQGLVLSGTSRCTISGNYVVLTTSNNQYDGIFLEDNGSFYSQYNSVVANVIDTKDSTTNKWRYGINASTANDTGNEFIGNVILGPATGAVNDATSGGNSFSHNQGYNPVGAVSSPAVPSSGTSLPNPFSVSMRVFIDGGTVSAVAINGVTTGQTSGVFLLEPGETITLTYSAVPTWTWFGQ